MGLKAERENNRNCLFSRKPVLRSGDVQQHYQAKPKMCLESLSLIGITRMGLNYASTPEL